MGRNLLSNTLDAATILHDTGAAVTATGNGTVGGSARILDLGTGFVESSLIIDIDAIDVSSGNELYVLTVQVSSSPTFASDVNVVEVINLGHSSLNGQSASTAPGRISRKLLNSADGNTPKRYMRMTHTLSGTTPSLTHRAFITNPPM